MRKWASLAVAAAALVAVPSAVAGTDYSWLGGSDNWSNPAQWNPNHVPNHAVDDNAIIGAGTVNLDGTFVVNDFTWTGGAITGAGSLGVFGTATLSGSGAKIITGATLNNSGMARWTDGIIRPLNSNATLNNLSSATFSIESDQSILSLTGGSFATLAFNNSGWLRKSISAGTTLFQDATLVNSGTVDVQAGTLAIARGSSTGNMNIAAGAALALGNFSFNSGATLTGTGTLQIGIGSAPATVSVNTDIAVDTLALTGQFASIDGTGRLTIGNRFDWTGGDLRGAGTIQINPGATLHMSAAGGESAQLFRSIDNQGTIDWTSTASLETGKGAVLSNSGVLDFKSDVSLNKPTALNLPAMTLDNTGTVSKSAGAGLTLIEAVFNNAGTVAVQTGTLAIGWGGQSQSGSSFTIDSGAVLQFRGPAFWLKPGTSITGAGSLQNSLGSVRADASLLAGRSLRMDGIELAIDGDLDTDQFHWNRGVLSGAGVTRLGSAQVMSNDWGVISGRTLDTNGRDFAWSGGQFNSIGTSAFGLGGGGTIVNSAGSTFSISVADLPGFPPPATNLGNVLYPSALVVNNSGSFVVNGPTNTHILGPMNNAGTVTVMTGSLTLDGGGVSSGTFAVGAGNRLIFAGGSGHSLSAGANVAGAGNVLFNSSGTVQLNVGASFDPGSVTVANGTVILGGSMSIPGAMILEQGMTIVPATAGSSSVSSLSLIDPAQLRIDTGATLSATTVTQNGWIHLNGGTLAAGSTADFAGGTVSGHGTIGGSVDSVAALFTPGEEVGETKTLDITGNLTFQASTLLSLEVDADALTNDLINVGGSTDLGGAYLFVSLVGNPNSIPPGQSFTIIHSTGGTSGALVFDEVLQAGRVDVYDAISFGTIGTFRITDTGFNVVLDDFAVPEPSLPLVVGVFAGLLIRRRRRRA